MALNMNLKGQRWQGHTVKDGLFFRFNFFCNAFHLYIIAENWPVVRLTVLLSVKIEALSLTQLSLKVTLSVLC